jgi:hypothetical protein
MGPELVEPDYDNEAFREALGDLGEEEDEDEEW